jgi:hypothetical protein
MNRLIAAFVLSTVVVALGYDATNPAHADGVRRYSSSQRASSQSYRYYRTACAYGDCACLRGIALATRAQVWWDRYQACTGN